MADAVSRGRGGSVRLRRVDAKRLNAKKHWTLASKLLVDVLSEYIVYATKTPTHKWSQQSILGHPNRWAGFVIPVHTGVCENTLLMIGPLEAGRASRSVRLPISGRAIMVNNNGTNTTNNNELISQI